MRKSMGAPGGNTMQNGSFIGGQQATDLLGDQSALPENDFIFGAKSA